MIRLAIGAIAILTLSGCLAEDRAYGRSAPYHSAREYQIKVAIPANAPTISQQFRPVDAGGGEPRWGPHFGMDVHAARGTPVVAAQAGTVVRSFYDPTFGNIVELIHGKQTNGQYFHTQYAHLKDRSVSVGDTVKRGEQVGTMGSSGLSASPFPHTHFSTLLKADRSERFKQEDSSDPHLFWVNGKGRVTCFDPQRTYDEVTANITHPLLCK